MIVDLFKQINLALWDIPESKNNNQQSQKG